MLSSGARRILSLVLLGAVLLAVGTSVSLRDASSQLGAPPRSTSSHVTLGQAVLAAKLNLYAKSLAHHDLLDTYVLLGDPALPINLPPHKLFLPLVAHNHAH